jgi:outer membrane lipoprotein-sorting protein
MQRLTKLPFKPSSALRLVVIAVLALSGCTTKETGAPQPESAQPSTVKAEPAEVLPDGAELLDAHTKAAGGADKIATFETIHATGKVDSGKQKLSGTTEMWWKKGGKFYVEQTIEGIGVSRSGYDGSTIWLDDPITGMRILEGEEAQSYIQSSLMFPSHDWRQSFTEARTLGKKPIEGGGEAWEVELVSKGGPNVIIGLDVDTKLISYMKTTQVTPMGSLPIEAYAEDYQDIAGYKFAMKKRSTVKRLLELQEDITAFEVNVPIDESKFVFPSKREQVVADPTAQPPVVVPQPAPAPKP